MFTSLAMPLLSAPINAITCQQASQIYSYDSTIEDPINVNKQKLKQNPSK